MGPLLQLQQKPVTQVLYDVLYTRTSAVARAILDKPALDYTIFFFFFFLFETNPTRLLRRPFGWGERGWREEDREEGNAPRITPRRVLQA